MVCESPEVSGFNREGEDEGEISSTYNCGDIAHSSTLDLADGAPHHRKHSLTENEEGDGEGEKVCRGV